MTPAFFDTSSLIPGLIEIGEISTFSQRAVTDNRRHVASLARHGVRVLSAEEFVRQRVT